MRVSTTYNIYNPVVASAHISKRKWAQMLSKAYDAFNSKDTVTLMMLER